MADDFWSGLGGLLGSGNSDLYGDLLTDKQRKALLFKEIGGGLDEISRRAAEAGKPSLMPGGKGWLGSALSGYGAGANAASEGMLKTMQTAQALRKAKRDQELTEQYFLPLLRDLTAKEKTLNLPPGTLTSAMPKSPAAGVTPAPPGMPAAPLTPTAPPGTVPTGAPPASNAPPPGPGFLGPTNEELGAPPVSMGLPSAGMSPFGLPGGPTQLGNTLPPAPALSGPPTPAERMEWAKTVGPGGQYLPIEDWVAQKRAGAPAGAPPPAAAPRQQNTGLLGDGGPYAQLASFPGSGPLGGSGGGGYGDNPFAGAGALAAVAGDDLPAGGPDVVIPSGPRLQRSDLLNVAAPAPGDRSDAAWEYYKPLIKKYESGGRNIEQGVVGPQGGYNPSTGTVTGPSSASGYLQMINPTWRSAAKDAGIDLARYPRAIDAPEAVQDEAGKALFKRNGLADWVPYNANLARAVGYQGGGRDTVIPSGPRLQRSDLMNVADTSPGAAPGTGAPTAPGGGTIPGTNMTPQGLAALNAMSKLLGHGDMFGSLLETYYKSPAYLGAAKRATEEVETEFAGPKAANAAAATQKYIQENETHKSALDMARDLVGKGVYFDKATGTMKPITNAAEAFAAIDNAKQTTEIKEYNFYAQQEKERGGIPKPFGIWDQERKKAGATTINTAEGFEAAQTKARVGVDAKIAQDLAEQAITGRRLMPVLDELAYLADKTPEGWKGPLAITTGRTLAGFGVAVPQGASNAEAFQALAQRLVPVVREPGATSQGEMNLYLNAGPSLAGTADGRRLIIDINRSMIQRSQEIAKVYRENIGKPDLYEKLAELDKPLFSPEQRAAMEGASKARAAASAAPAAPAGAAAPTGGGRPVATGPNGEKLVLSPDGKQWVPQ